MRASLTCRKCNRPDLTREDFYWSSPSAKRQRRKSYCKDCEGKLAKEKRAKAVSSKPPKADKSSYCPKCRRDGLSLESFYVTKDTAGRKRRLAYCKECHSALNRSNRETPWGRIKEFRARAMQSGIPITIGVEDVRPLIGKPCAYCGSPIVRLSLDRADNALGYTPENVVPCCKWCNYTKGTGSLAFFYEQCRKVTETMPQDYRTVGDSADGGSRYRD